jgi:hypothetical protein
MLRTRPEHGIREASWRARRFLRIPIVAGTPRTPSRNARWFARKASVQGSVASSHDSFPFLPFPFPFPFPCSALFRERERERERERVWERQSLQGLPADRALTSFDSALNRCSGTQGSNAPKKKKNLNREIGRSGGQNMIVLLISRSPDLPVKILHSQGCHSSKKRRRSGGSFSRGRRRRSVVASGSRRSSQRRAPTHRCSRS